MTAKQIFYQLGAAKAGLVIGFSEGLDGSELVEAGPDLIIHSFYELPEIISQGLR